MKKVIAVATLLMSAHLAALASSVQAAPSAMTIAVLGDVKKPGLHKLSVTTNLMDAIVAVGGTTARPDAVRITVKRNETAGLSAEPSQPEFDLLQSWQAKTAVLSIQASELLTSDQQHNLPLQDGDFIFVQRQQAAVPTSPPTTAKPQQKDAPERSEKSFPFNGTTIYAVPLSARKSSLK